MTDQEKIDRYNFLHDVLDASWNRDLFWRTWEDGTIRVYVNTNDLFAWACADAEEITPENLPLYIQSLEDGGSIYGEELFACRVAKSRPQGAAYPMGEKYRYLWPLFDACGPERPIDFANPYTPQQALEKHEREIEARRVPA